MNDESKPRILVADDEFVISRCLTFMFKKEGFECRAVVDGQAALDAMREQVPDLLVLDLDMPRKNGFEVCRELREDARLKEIHVVVLTAKGQPITSDWRIRIPADHFVLKPFDPRALLEHVRETLAARREPALVG